MDNNIAVVHDQPTVVGFSFYSAFPFMFFMRFFDHSIGQSIQHAVAGGGTNNKVIREGSNLFNIQQENIFAFFIFQGIDNGTRKFKCIQMSPLGRRSNDLSRYYKGFNGSAYKWV
jgi:hypothetical protein